MVITLIFGGAIETGDRSGHEVREALGNSQLFFATILQVFVQESCILII